MAQRQRLHEAHEVGVGPLRRADPGLRSPPGRGAPRGPGARRATPSGAASGSAASSASLRKVVILPPQTDSSGARRGGVEVEQVVARHRRRVARLVVEQRPHAGVGPDHVAPASPAARSSGSPARTGRRSRRRRCAPAPIGAVVLDVGGADQREVALVGDGEDDALVGVLEDVGVVVLEQPRHDDVAALDQAQRLAARGCVRCSPRNCAAHGPAALTSARAATLALPPSRAFAARTCQRSAPRRASTQRVRGQDRRAALGGVDRVEHHQPRVVDPAVGIDEALAEAAASAAAPAGWLRRSTVREPGSTSRRARWS